MAVSRGKESTEGSVKKLYVGVGSSYIKAVNPTKSELEQLYGKAQEKDPEYISEVEVNDTKVAQVRLTFYVSPNSKKYLDAQNQPIETIIPVTLFLRKQYNYGKNSGKYQIIDKYGRTAWATKEDINAKKIPVYSNGSPANISEDYRPAYDGEAELVGLIRAYLNIPTVEKWENKKVVGLIDNPSDAEVLLDNMEGLFKGDFKEIKEVFGYQPNNEVKIAFGVRTSDNGQQYQAAYTKMFLKNSISDYSKLDKSITDTKMNGGLATTEFECTELHEYQVTPTSFNTPSETQMPMEETPAFDAQSPWGMA